MEMLPGSGCTYLLLTYADTDDIFRGRPQLACVLISPVHVFEAIENRQHLPIGQASTVNEPPFPRLCLFVCNDSQSFRPGTNELVPPYGDARVHWTWPTHSRVVRARNVSIKGA